MGSEPSRRLWRLRRLHQSIDAVLVEGEAGVVELQFLLNGSVIFSRRWPDRAPAFAEATARRGELEREGWMPHW